MKYHITPALYAVMLTAMTSGFMISAAAKTTTQHNGDTPRENTAAFIQRPQTNRPNNAPHGLQRAEQKAGVDGAEQASKNNPKKRGCCAPSNIEACNLTVQQNATIGGDLIVEGAITNAANDEGFAINCITITNDTDTPAEVVKVGCQATAVDQTTAVGFAAQSTAPDAASTAVGWKSSAQEASSTAFGTSSTAGFGCTTVGARTFATGPGGIAIGNNSASTGIYSSAIGVAAFADNEEATAVGNAAIALQQGTAVGRFAGASTGSTAVGWNSLAFSADDSATALGYFSTATGISSTAVGHNALATGENSTAVGAQALALGLRAHAFGVTARALDVSANAIGFNAQAGFGSIALGRDALADGPGAIALGNTATATGPYGSAVGVGSVAADAFTVALGNSALAVGESATSIGQSSFADKQGTSLGQNAYAIGVASTALGYCSTGDHQQSTAIGAGAYTTKSNQMRLGSVGDNFFGCLPAGDNALEEVVTTATIISERGDIVATIGNVRADNGGMFAVSFNTVSDANAKQNIKPASIGLEFIEKLNPVVYQYKVGQDQQTQHCGLLAQEILKLIKENNIQGFGGVTYDAATGRYNIAYTEFIAPLVKAIQQLAATNSTLTEKQRAYEATQQDLIKQIGMLKSALDTITVAQQA